MIAYEEDSGWHDTPIPGRRIYLAGARLRETDTNTVLATYSSALGTTDTSELAIARLRRQVREYAVDYFARLSP